ncbi:MAG: hypothetical protein KF860_11190 [Cyclobacteriaceae bacterium]|nr:hypothetical protein [Cyclobacteriaceae bacterium]
MNLKSAVLEEFKINIKHKLAALWTSVMFCYVYGDYFELYVPEKVEGLLNGSNVLNSPVALFTASVALAIPAVMISVSVLAKPVLNRWLNIIFGVLYSLLMILIGFGSISAWYSFYVFLAFTESILTLLIVWLAWKWPKKIPIKIILFSNSLPDSSKRLLLLDSLRLIVSQ